MLRQLNLKVLVLNDLELKTNLDESSSLSTQGISPSKVSSFAESSSLFNIKSYQKALVNKKADETLLERQVLSRSLLETGSTITNQEYQRMLLVLNKKAKSFEEFLSTIGTELLNHRAQKEAIRHSFKREQERNRILREGLANRAGFELPEDPLLDPVDKESMATLLHRLRKYSSFNVYYYVTNMKLIYMDMPYQDLSLV